MKSTIAILLILINVNCTSVNDVYICDSPGAKSYHLKENCRGLSNCQHKLIIMTLEKAKRKGRTLCAWEKK